MRLCHQLSAAVLLAVASFTPVAQADVKVPPVFSDHMVLQRDMAAPIWGTAEAGEEIVVSIAGQSHEAKADAEGKWSVKLKPLKAGGPHVLSIKGANTIELEDVLVGDVWIGSGQSNMAGGVRGYAKNDEVLAELAAGTYPQLRFCRGKGGAWQESNPQTNAGFSAILFAFGQRLQKDLDVPVGLILGAVGGTPSGRWLTDEMLASKEQTKAYKAANGGDLYKQHILPVVPYGIRGVLWDQGESGTAIKGLDQFTTMEALIGGWRDVWGQGEFPFLYVQKPSGGGCAWDKSNPTTRMANDFAALPATPQQGNAGDYRAHHVGIMQHPGTAMVTARDLGSGIHPRNKSGYGHRAVRVALGFAYGQEVEIYGPIYDSHKVEGDKIRVHFTHVGEGLAFKHGDGLQGFAVAGKDGKYHWAEEAEPRTVANRSNAATADVIVYGSTPGGFCAAIAAAREGASVILLEPTDHVGAMSTGGLSHCDSNQMVRSTLMGLFDEWHTRVVKDYTNRGLNAPYDPSKEDQSRWTFEPHVATRVTMQMLDDAGVKVLTERYLKSVTKDGTRITSLVTDNGTFTARVFVDGTYEGDLMAAAGVDWTIGREGREEYGESFAGKQYPKPKMNINGFDDEGRPLPLITTNDAGDKEAGDKNVMTYSFRLCLTEDPDNRVPMPKPANYDPARFEIVRRALQAGERRVGFDLYPLPGKKLDGNNSIGGQFSIGLVGGGRDWHSADKAGRQKIWEAHKQYTLEFYHFLTTDPVVPKAIRDRYARLGLCKDEFANYDHFSPALYVRESRRMKGLYVISQKDILETPKKDDPIAISSFPIDSHDCQRVALKGGGVINEGTIFPVRRKNPKQGYAYHVPYRAILPKPERCDNLLVPVALSCTHVGISSLRIEGAWMVIGQGAGIAAALAADQGVPVQKLAYAKLRERLLAQGQVLELPDVSDLPTQDGSIVAKSLPGIVLDDAQAKLSGTWSRSTNFKPYIEDGYIFCGEDDPESKGDGKTTATFRFQVPKSGQYQVLMAYSAHSTRAKHVPVTISTGADKKTFAVDQTKSLPTGKQFRPVATVNLQADMQTVIQITNADTAGFVILDALQLLPVE